MRDTGRFKERYDFSLDSRQLGVVMFAVLAAAALIFVLGMSVGRQWERKAAGVKPEPPLNAARADEAGDAEEVLPAAPRVDPKDAAPEKKAGKDAGDSAAPKPGPAAGGEGIPPEELTFPKTLTSESGKTEPLTQAKKPAANKADVPRKVAAARQGGYTVQVGAYSEESVAKKQAGSLAKKGYDAFVHRSTAKGSVLFKVCVGSFATRNEASKLSKKLESSERLKPYVTSY